MVVSTGVGGGIVLDGRLLDGDSATPATSAMSSSSPTADRACAAAAAASRPRRRARRSRRSPGLAPERPRRRRSNGQGCSSAERWRRCGNLLDLRLAAGRRLGGPRLRRAVLRRRPGRARRTRRARVSARCRRSCPAVSAPMGPWSAPPRSACARSVRRSDRRVTCGAWSRPTPPKPRPTGRRSRRSSPSTCPPAGRASARSRDDAVDDFAAEWRRDAPRERAARASWPTEYGGAGLSALEQVIVAEEFAKAGVPTGVGNDVFGIQMVGNTHPAVGHRRAEAALPPAHPRRRGPLVPGLLRAERRIRPRQPRVPGRARRRRVGDQRPEDLDVGRPPRRLDLRARPHRPRRAEAQGHHVPARRWTSPASRCGRSR